MGLLFDRWPASLSTLGSIEVLALFALQVIGPTEPGTPPWVVSAIVVVGGLLVPTVLIGIVLARITIRWWQRRRED